MQAEKMDVGLEVTSWANVVLGLGVAASGALSRSATLEQSWVALVAGILVAALSGFDAWAAFRRHAWAALWPSTASAVLGAGLAAFLWYTGAGGAFLLVTGGCAVAIAIVGLYDAWESLQAPLPPKPVA